MRDRSRAGRIFKWVGLALCAAIFSAWGVSLLWPFSWRYGEARRSLDVTGGLVGYREWTLPDAPIFVEREYAKALDGVFPEGYFRHVWAADRPINLRYFGIRWPGVSRRSFVRGAFVPLWLPFLIVLIPTIFLFWGDRRYPKGSCQSCNYNLTGNTSGICPECGTPIPKDTKEPELTTDPSKE